MYIFDVSVTPFQGGLIFNLENKEYYYFYCSEEVQENFFGVLKVKAGPFLRKMESRDFIGIQKFFNYLLKDTYAGEFYLHEGRTHFIYECKYGFLRTWSSLGDQIYLESEFEFKSIGPPLPDDLLNLIKRYDIKSVLQK